MAQYCEQLKHSKDKQSWKKKGYIHMKRNKQIGDDDMEHYHGYTAMLLNGAGSC